MFRYSTWPKMDNSKCDTKILRALITAEIDIVTAFLKHQKAKVIDMDMEGTEKSYEINT